MIIKSEILYTVLTEGRVEDAKLKYPGRDKSIDVLSKSDPSGNNKYLNWMCRMVFEQESIPKHVIDAVTYFHNNVVRFEQKDINQYKDLKQLLLAIEIAKSKVSKKEIKEAGVEKIFENNNIIVLHPKTHAASCKYGSETRWCVTMKHDPSYFRHYSASGPLFFFIDKRRLESEPGLPRKQYWKVAAHYRIQDLTPSSLITSFLSKPIEGNKKDMFLTAMKTRLQTPNIVEYYTASDRYVTEKTVAKYIPDLPQIKEKMVSYVLEELGRFFDLTAEWMEKYSKYVEQQQQWRKNRELSSTVFNSTTQIPRMSQELMRLIQTLDPNFDIESLNNYIKHNWQELADKKAKELGIIPQPSEPIRPALKWYDVELDKKLDQLRKDSGKR